MKPKFNHQRETSMKTEGTNCRTELALFAVIATALIGSTPLARHFEHKEWPQ